MEQTEQWVWYEDSIAYTKEIDYDTDFCEVQILEQNPRRFQGKLTWSLSHESYVTSLSNTTVMSEHRISEIRPGLFIVDDGDEDYVPSEEESSDDSELDDLDQEDY